MTHLQYLTTRQSENVNHATTQSKCYTMLYLTVNGDYRAEAYEAETIVELA